MVNRFIDNDTHPIAILFSDKFIKDYKNLCMKQLEKYQTMGTIDAISYILTCWNTWDNYSLSILYLSFFYYIYSSKVPKQDFIKIMLETLLLNIHPNPSMRLSVQETSFKFNESLLNFVNNIKNFKYITNLNKDFVENKKKFENRANKINEKIETVSSRTRS